MTLVIAHRGYSSKYPENTLLSIRKAVELGVDGVEFDVRKTKDSQVVLFHDKRLKRLTGVKGELSKKTYRELLKYDVQGQRIPFLSEVLSFLKDKVSLIIIDVKVPGIEKEVLKIVKEHMLRDKTVISSFNSRILEAFRALDDDIQLGYLLDNRPDKIIKWQGIHKKLRLYSVHPYNNRPLSIKFFIQQIQRKHLKIFTWPLRYEKNEKQMKSLMAFGVDGVMTDYPDRLIKIKNPSQH